MGIPLTARGEQFRQSVAARLVEIERGISAKIPTDPVLARDFRRNLVSQIDREMRRVRTRTSIGVDIDRNRFTRSMSSFMGLLGRFGSQVSDIAGKAVAPLNSAISSVSGAFNSATSSISGMLLFVLKLGTVAPFLAAGLNILGGSAIAAFGAIAAGVVGLPALLTTLIAPIAAIAIGMDGIKRAAEPLKDELKSLSDSVNIAFEMGMRPVFEKLQALFPTLNVGLAEVARGVTRVASDFAGILTTPAGIENIRVALGGVSTAIDGMRPGLSALFSALLNVAGTRELYVILGDTIGGVAERFAGMIERVRASGDLTGALDQLKNVLFEVTDLIALLAEGAIKFFRSAGPGLSSFFESLTATLGRVDWSALGESFGSMMERLGNAIERIPPETWRGLADAVGNLAEKFISWAESGGLESLIGTFTTLINVLSVAADLFFLAEGAVSGFIDFLSGIPSTIGGAASSIGGFFSGIGESAASGLDGVVGTVNEKLPQIPESVDTNLAGLPDQIGGFFGQAKDRVGETLESLSESTSASLEGFGGRLDEFFSNLPDRIGYWIGFAVTKAGLLIMDGVESIAGWFGQLPGRLESLAVDMATRTIAVFMALPGQLSSLATQAVSSVVGVISALPGQIASLAGRAVQGAIDFFTTLPGKLGSLASQALEAVAGALGGLPARVGAIVSKMVSDVIGWFKSLPGRLLQAGKDAVQGFIDGVKSKAQSVVDAAKNVVSGALRGARDAIRSGSPSKAFRDIGHDTIQGYIIGLRDKLTPLLAQVQAIFSQAVAAAQTAAGGLDFGLGALNIGGRVTADAVGSANTTSADLPTLMDALAGVLNAADWRLDGSDLTLAVNRGNLQLARR